MSSRLTTFVVAAAFVPVASAFGQCPASPAQTEGPFYVVGSPETLNLQLPGEGPQLVVHGTVVDLNCDPIPYTWVDVWHADAVGAYDPTAPFRYRGHGFTNALGEFTLTTIVPGLYPGRTRHLHVKIDADNTTVLTTQLYLPGVPQNAADGLYNPALLMTALSGDYINGMVATFEFHRAIFEPSCAADTDNNDIVDGADLGTLLSAWGTDGVDLNGDGATDGADLGLMLSSWGPC